MPTTTLTFLGTDSAVPGPGNDVASFLLNGHVLVDLGWSAPHRLLASGKDPLEVDAVVFTHLHHDHYLALPQLLYLRAMRGKREGGWTPLTLIGPAEDLEGVAARAWELLAQGGRFFAEVPPPALRPVVPGEAFAVGELAFETLPAPHPVQAMSLRVRDAQTGVRLGISGDRAFEPAAADFFRGLPVLVHECALGAEALPRDRNPYLHSSAQDAAETARAADVGLLYLVHCTAAQAPEALRAARAIFPRTELALPGTTLVWPAG
jgi:ribonuclease Z